MHIKNGKNLLKGFENIINGNIDNAINELKKIILDGDEILEIYILIGTLMRKKGEYEKAVHMHEAALSIKGITPDLVNYVKYELIKDYQGLNNHEKALEYLNELAQRDKSPILLKQIALMQLKLKKYDEAINYFIKYQKASGKDVKNYIIKCYSDKLDKLKEKDSTDYYKFLKKVLKQFPDESKFFLLNIQHLFDMGKKAKAVELTKEFMEKSMVKSDKDLDFVKNVYFDYLNIETFVKAVLKKVAANDPCPLYYTTASDYFIKVEDERKSRDVLKEYMKRYGYKVIIVQKYAELANEEILLQLYKDKQPYKCNNCNTAYAEYSDECEKCGSLKTIDFA